jgi:hypothetical protein
MERKHKTLRKLLTCPSINFRVEVENNFLILCTMNTGAPLVSYSNFNDINCLRYTNFFYGEFLLQSIESATNSMMEQQISLSA